jgi:hypothetical protein
MPKSVEKNPLILNMKFVESLFLLVCIAASLFLVIGLYKPWALLWWADKQNRRKILKLYGSVALLAFIIYYALRFANE